MNNTVDTELNSLVWFNNKNYMKAEVVTDSLKVAQVFNKKHKVVLNKIDILVEQLKSVEQEGQPKNMPTQHIFYKSSYISEQNGEQYRKYNMNFNAFTLLVMGFTGKKALKFKLQYIAEFNKMYVELQETRQYRKGGKPIRRDVLSMVGRHVKQRDCLYNKFPYVTNFIYEILFGATASELKELNGLGKNHNLRDHMDKQEIMQVAQLEDEIAILLDFGLCWEEVKRRIKVKYS